MPSYLDFMSGLPGKGEIPAKYAIVGIAPSTKRPIHRKLEPFGAASFSIIEKIRERLPSLYVTNLIKEPVAPGRRPTTKQLELWAPRLLDELRVVQPERVLTLGDLPSKTLCPHMVTLREDHGTFFRNLDLNCWVIPTYHFSAGARDPSFKRMTSRDLERFACLADPVPPEYHLVNDSREIPPLGSEVVLDLETTGVDLGCDILQLGLSWKDEDGKDQVYIVPNPNNLHLRDIGNRLKARACRLVGHNLSFDLRVLLEKTSGKWPVTELTDTMILAHISGEEGLSLKHLTTMHTKRPGSRYGGTYTDPLYLTEDLLSTEAIYRVFAPAEKTYLSGVLHDWIPITAITRIRGVHIDLPRLEAVTAELKESKERILSELNELSGSSTPENWNSTTQVARMLQRLKIPLSAETPSGNASVAEGALLPLADSYPVVGKLLEYRGLEKLISGFCDSYGKRLTWQDPNLHPSLRITGTSTGRFSCADPNLQQVPRKGPLKSVFTSRFEEGSYGLLDLSQAELRVAALLSNDNNLARALQTADAHTYIASIVFGKPEDQITSTERKASKAVTFGLLYGGSPKGLAQRGHFSANSITEVLNVFFREFADLGKWMGAVRREAEETQEIHTLFGRRRSFREFIDSGDIGQMNRRAVNTPVQGLAAEITLDIGRHANRFLRQRKLSSRILFGVHDSIVFEINAWEEDLVAIACQEAFAELWESPLKTLPLFNELPLLGDFVLGKDWASVEETNEGYNPIKIWKCSSAGNQ